MKKSWLLGIGVLALAGAVGVYAQQGSPGRSNKIVLENCLISAFEQVQIPGLEPGAIASFEPNNSREGTEVKEGDVLAHLDKADLVAKKKSAELEIIVAKEKAESDAELEVAKATMAVGEKEVQGAKEANRKQPGTVPQNEMRRLELTVERARHEIRLREMERGVHAHEATIKEAQLEAVEVEIDRREVKSPIDGVVVERLKNRGEWVQPGETILKVVRLDKLRVEGFVPANLYSPRDIAGAKVVVTVEMPNDKVETATGTIQFVSPVVEASGEYRVWTEVDNRKVKDDEGKQHWVFQPGTVAKMELTLKSGASAATKPISTKIKFNK